VSLGIMFTVEKYLLLLLHGFSYFFHTTHNRLLHITSKKQAASTALLAAYFLLVISYFSTLKMEAVYSFEMSVNFYNVVSHPRESLQSLM
jgi:hypothetical protein